MSKAMSADFRHPERVAFHLWMGSVRTAKSRSSLAHPPLPLLSLFRTTNAVPRPKSGPSTMTPPLCRSLPSSTDSSSSPTSSSRTSCWTSGRPWRAGRASGDGRAVDRGGAVILWCCSTWRTSCRVLSRSRTCQRTRCRSR